MPSVYDRDLIFSSHLYEQNIFYHILSTSLHQIAFWVERMLDFVAVLDDATPLSSIIPLLNDLLCQESKLDLIISLILEDRLDENFSTNQINQSAFFLQNFYYTQIHPKFTSGSDCNSHKTFQNAHLVFCSILSALHRELDFLRMMLKKDSLVKSRDEEDEDENVDNLGEEEENTQLDVIMDFLKHAQHFVLNVSEIVKVLKKSVYVEDKSELIKFSSFEAITEIWQSLQNIINTLYRVIDKVLKNFNFEVEVCISPEQLFNIVCDNEESHEVFFHQITLLFDNCFESINVVFTSFNELAKPQKDSAPPEKYEVVNLKCMKELGNTFLSSYVQHSSHEKALLVKEYEVKKCQEKLRLKDEDLSACRAVNQILEAKVSDIEAKTLLKKNEKASLTPHSKNDNDAATKQAGLGKSIAKVSKKETPLSSFYAQMTSSSPPSTLLYDSREYEIERDKKCLERLIAENSRLRGTFMRESLYANCFNLRQIASKRKEQKEFVRNNYEIQELQKTIKEIRSKVYTFSSVGKTSRQMKNNKKNLYNEISACKEKLRNIIANTLPANIHSSNFCNFYSFN